MSILVQAAGAGGGAVSQGLVPTPCLSSWLDLSGELGLRGEEPRPFGLSLLRWLSTTDSGRARGAGSAAQRRRGGDAEGGAPRVGCGLGLLSSESPRRPALVELSLRTPGMLGGGGKAGKEGAEEAEDLLVSPSCPPPGGQAHFYTRPALQPPPRRVWSQARRGAFPRPELSRPECGR